MGYIVEGGIYTDMSFREVIAGTEEKYGPYPTRDRAVEVWKGRMFAKVDICPHRLFIKEVANDR